MGISFYFLNEAFLNQLKGNLERKKLSVMALVLSVFSVYYLYLNERHYYGLRIP